MGPRNIELVNSSLLDIKTKHSIGKRVIEAYRCLFLELWNEGTSEAAVEKDDMRPAS
jgi:hypothetical protein